MKTEKMKIIMKAYGVKHMAVMTDESTWFEVLDVFIKMLNAAGYSVRDAKKVQEWLDNTEVLDD